MNTRKLRKVLLTLCSALLLVSLSVGMTIAYLTDTTEVVTNTFTVGNVNIKLDEAEYVEGVATGKRTETGSSYKLMPGLSYEKDPTVTVETGSESCFVRMRVTIEGIADILAQYAAAEKEFLPQYCVEGWDDTIWLSKGYDATTGELEFWYKEEVATPKTLEPLFTKIVVDGEVFDEDNMDLLKNVKIKIAADAIQSAGFDSQEAAWTAYNTQKAADNQ